MTFHAWLFIGGFAAVLAVIFRFLANYGSDIRHQNGQSFWPNMGQAPFAQKGRDSTVEGYARQAWEFAQQLDQQAQDAMATAKKEETRVIAPKPETTELTGG